MHRELDAQHLQRRIVTSSISAAQHLELSISALHYTEKLGLQYLQHSLCTSSTAFGPRAQHLQLSISNAVPYTYAWLFSIFRPASSGQHLRASFGQNA